ncbi:MAG: hypothetical protein CMM45_09360 [Rhodospirillaceae bacterium]|nr:hypothetical protein [Rhodospirillaceae bacterium]
MTAPTRNPESTFQKHFSIGRGIFGRRSPESNIAEKNQRFGANVNNLIIHAGDFYLNEKIVALPAGQADLAGLPGPQSQYGGLAVGPNSKT